MPTYKIAGLRRQDGAIGVFEPFLDEVEAPDDDSARSLAYSSQVAAGWDIQLRAVVPVTNIKTQVDTITGAYWRERFQPAGTWKDAEGKVRHSVLAQEIWESLNPVTSGAAASNEAILVQVGVPETIAKLTASHEDLRLEADRLSWSGYSGGDGFVLDRQLSPPLRDVEEWCNSFRWVWTDDERLIVTYCEGDVSGQLFFTPEAYALAMHEATAFYADH